MKAGDYTMRCDVFKIHHQKSVWTFIWLTLASDHIGVIVTSDMYNNTMDEI